MAKLQLIVVFVAKPGKENELKAALRAMLVPTHAEPGEKIYDLYQGDDPQRFFFVETWASQEAFEFHKNTPHLKALGPTIEPLLERPGELSMVTQIQA